MIWGEAELFLGIWGAKAKLLGRQGHYLQGVGAINALFLGIKGAQPPPLGGLKYILQIRVSTGHCPLECLFSTCMSTNLELPTINSFNEAVGRLQHLQAHLIKVVVINLILSHQTIFTYNFLSFYLFLFLLTFLLEDERQYMEIDR